MKTRRRILYVSGTRADFGLMASTLAQIHADPRLTLEVLVTGMHLDGLYGLTVTEIERSGLPIRARIEVEAGTSTGALMGANVGRMLTGFIPQFEAASPDLVLLLGDRGEMLAGAIAALHLGIPVAHIHGGERSGTVDEPVRHAISKLSNLHLVATEQSRERLIAMGEDAAAVHVVGAPGLDGLAELPGRDKQQLALDHAFDPERPLALLVYHPVVQEATQAGEHVKAIVDSLLASGAQIVALNPNSDAGSDAIRGVLQERSDKGQLRLFTHFGRQEFAEFMAAADVMIGNSSSGIIEAATFGTPVINVGSRQNLRERNANVLDVRADSAEISRSIATVMAAGRFARGNVYGDGTAAGRVTALLASVNLSDFAQGKTNAY